MTRVTTTAISPLFIVSNVTVELLPDNAAPQADAIYLVLGIPYSALVFGLRQYYSQAPLDTARKVVA